jgi:hypothetical protein
VRGSVQDLVKKIGIFLNTPTCTCKYNVSPTSIPKLFENHVISYGRAILVVGEVIIDNKLGFTKRKKKVRNSIEGHPWISPSKFRSLFGGCI